jgi:hypothetical protein
MIIMKVSWKRKINNNANFKVSDSNLNILKKMKKRKDYNLTTL